MYCWCLWISCKSFRLDTWVLFVGLFMELSSGWLPETSWIVMAKVSSRAHSVFISCVEAMFYLHTSISTDINVVSPCGFLCKVVFNPHVHVKSLIGFFLAVLNAWCFFFILRSVKFEINAVLMALFEKKFRKSILF